jgi:transcriptional regulator with XRE-family HTH domain
MDKKPLGRKINIARKDRGFTSEKLAEKCNINATYLRQIESGVKTPSLPVFVSLCQELRVSPSYLLAELLLPDPEIQEMDELLDLWKKATPQQIKMISAIIRSAMDSLPK